MLSRTLTPEEIDKLPWRALIEDVDWAHRRWAAAQRLHEHANELERSGGTDVVIVAEALRVIGGALSAQLQPESAKIFGPMVMLEDRRSFSIDDIAEPERALLSRLSLTVEDPWLKARFGDLALSCAVAGAAREWKLGQHVVHAYCEYVEHVFLTSWAIDGIRECRRGLQLFWAYSKKDAAVWDRFWVVIQAQIADGLQQRKPGLVFPLADEAIKRNTAITASLAAQVEATATALTQQSQHQDASRYFEYAHKLWRSAGDASASQRCQRLQGESLVDAAAAVSGIAAPYWLMQAIQVLRRGKAEAARVDQLKEELSRLQRASLDDFTAHRFEFDISGVIARVQDTVVGPQLFDGLLQMAYGLTGWPDVDNLRQEVLANAQRHPISTLVDSQHADEDGAIVATQRALDVYDETTIYEAVVEHACRFLLDFRAKAVVSTAVPLLYGGFQPTLYEIKEIVEASPMAPPDRSESLARGLHAGLMGDWVATGAYLIPLAEAWVRSHLQRGGVSTRTIHDDGTQEEITLTSLLDHPDAQRMFGRGLQFELKVLLTEVLGYNLRNTYCHGLLSDAGLATTGVVNLWWTTWRFLLFPWAPSYLEAYRAARVSMPEGVAASSAAPEATVTDVPQPPG